MLHRLHMVCVLQAGLSHEVVLNILEYVFILYMLLAHSTRPTHYIVASLVLHIKDDNERVDFPYSR